MAGDGFVRVIASHRTQIHQSIACLPVSLKKLNLDLEIDVPDRRKERVLQRARPHEKMPLKVALQKT